MEPIVRKRIDVFKDPRRRVGTTYVHGQGVHVNVWAHEKSDVQVQWLDRTTQLLEKNNDGYFSGTFADAKPGDRYAFVIDGKTLPDPASRSQPDGTRGPSQVVDEAYAWTDGDYKGVPYGEWVIYELHVGTYSARGDFDGVIDDLPRLKDLGVNVIELMPVSQFPGGRNWGYDGVFPHAVQNSYGGPEGLKKLVDRCHAMGMAVVLDVVYNHIGPEGGVQFEFGPYFQTKYKTPWGESINFDGPMSEHVRNYFLQSVWQWLVEFHIDGLRLDAVHTIFDTSPIPFLEEMARIKTYAEKERGLPLHLIAETEMNDSRLLASYDLNGMGIDAHWADDLHHVLHVMITGETGSYYVDYGGLDQLARTYRNGVSFEGEYSFSRHRCHGRSYAGIDRKRLIVETQNHDQIGNRIHGKRLNSLVDFDRIKLMAASIFLSPFTPLFFMGEELHLETPFHYFVSHEGPELLQMIRDGRNKDFNLTMEGLDPSSIDLFHQSTLTERIPLANTNAEALNRLYRELIALSKEVRTYECEVEQDDRQTHIILRYYAGSRDREMRVVLSYNPEQTTHTPPSGPWTYRLALCDYLPEHEHRAGQTADETIIIPPYSAMVLTRGF